MLTRIAALAILPLLTGCLSGPVGLASKVALENATSTPAHAAAVTPVSAVMPAAAPIGPPPVVTQQQAMQQIAPMLSQLAAADPKLHAETLSQLSDVEPSLWSLTVQRALNTMEYRQQLAGTPEPKAIAAAPIEPAAPTPTQAPVQASAPAPTGVVQTSAALEIATSPTVVGHETTPQAIANPHFKVASARVPATPTGATLPATAQTVQPVQQEEEQVEKTWREHLATAIATLDRDAAAKPRSSGEAYQRVRLQLMQLVAGEDAEAAQATPGLSTAEQGYWSNQIYALATLLSDEGSSDHRTRADAAARHLMEASAKLRALGTLQVRNFVTCREVYGYGAYEALDKPRYAPGDQVILYAEIDNYQSDTDDVGYRTVIASSYRLVSPEGREVASGDFNEVDDLCLTRRRDFHIQYGLTLPTSLASGEYRLELAVNDRLGDKIGHDQLTLTVAGR